MLVLFVFVAGIGRERKSARSSMNESCAFYDVDGVPIERVAN